jgi:4-hydroxybenzoate polyprenyltransferase
MLRLRLLGRAPHSRLRVHRSFSGEGTPTWAQPVQASADGAAATARFPDQRLTWVDTHAPRMLAPYLKLVRVDRPIGTWLVLLPSWWGLALCAGPGSLPSLPLLATFGAGAFLMRSAGCTMNDLWDRRIDFKVARTAGRPLAAGTISVPAAVTFLGAQLSAGLCLLMSLPPAAVSLGYGAVAIAALYPAAKRVTHFPQVVLGAAMNYGILMAWATTAGARPADAGASEGSLVADLSRLLATSLDPSCLAELLASPAAVAQLPAVALLYVGAAGWTVVYDTLYAHQDKSDDVALGLGSTAVWMGERTVPILTGVALASGAAWLGAGVVAGLGAPYFVTAAAATGHMLWQVRTADLGDAANLGARFKSNTAVGWAMLAGILAGSVTA